MYLVSNHPFRPSVHELRDRESVNALGGTWHEITHVSERTARHLSQRLGRKGLSLKDATLYQVTGEKSVFAVILNTRYGIPDPDTLKRIWGENVSPNIVDAAELDQRLPGHDLVSVQYWPQNDRARGQPGHSSA